MRDMVAGIMLLSVLAAPVVSQTTHRLPLRVE